MGLTESERRADATRARRGIPASPAALSRACGAFVIVLALGAPIRSPAGAADSLGATLAPAISGAGDTLHVAQWLVIGPFPVGSREGLVDPAWPIDPARVEPVEGDSVPSLMAPGGWARWTRVSSDGGMLKLEHQGVDWDALSDQWGVAGIVGAALAHGTIDLDSPGSYGIETSGIGTLYIDGARYVGNPYGIGEFRAPIDLEAGRHSVVVRVSGFGPREVSLRLVRSRGPLELLAGDLTLPDLVEGEALEGWGAAPIVNTSGREIRGALLRFGDEGMVEEETVEIPIPCLPPEGILKLPFPVWARSSAPGGAFWRGKIVVSAEGVDRAYPCSLRVREKSASRILTFRSRQDGSVQHCALLPPSSDSRGPFALILSLHGAGVRPDPQAGSYAPKDWAYVAAPTNTRPFGFDWQDWGRRNAMETLDNILERFPIDQDRVILTGHSMGGHGTWHVGLAHADRFAALAPSAGWASFALYVPFTLRRDAAAADPRLRVLWERAMAPDNPLPLMGNARGMPVFVLHGGADDNVPVFHGRMLSQRAREAGARVIYREAPGMGHWWDRPETPGVDCVDDSEMMAFLSTQRRRSDPDTVHLVSADLGVCSRAHWLTVEEAMRPLDRIEVEARVLRGEETGFEIRTAGVRAFSIDPSGVAAPGPLSFRADGGLLRTEWREGSVFFRLEGGRWEFSGAERSRRFRGPLKAAFFDPFVLVYGTGGDEAQNRAMRRAAVLDAQAWYLRADGFAPVVADTAVTEKLIATRNLILYAIPGANAVLAKIESSLPIAVEPFGVELRGRDRKATIGRHDFAEARREPPDPGDGRFYQGKGLAARFVAANPLAPDRLVEVIAGTDLAGFDLALLSNPCSSGSGYPDFLIYDAQVRRDGWAGFRAAGYFDIDGRLPSVAGEAYFR